MSNNSFYKSPVANPNTRIHFIAQLKRTTGSVAVCKNGKANIQPKTPATQTESTFFGKES